MKILVGGMIYDSTETTILVHFDKNEEEMFNMKKFVSGPPTMSLEAKEALIQIDLIKCSHDYVTFDIPKMALLCRDCGEVIK